MRMTVTQIINLLHKSVADKSYDLVPTEKNRNSRRKHGLTIYDIEDFLKSISETDLYSGLRNRQGYAKRGIIYFYQGNIKWWELLC